MEPYSENAANAVANLWGAGPTNNVKEREVKGYRIEDGDSWKVYFNSNDLREIAAGLLEVADWLDARADAGAP